VEPQEKFKNLFTLFSAFPYNCLKEKYDGKISYILCTLKVSNYFQHYSLFLKIVIIDSFHTCKKNYILIKYRKQNLYL